jgi:hypothetical protein
MFNYDSLFGYELIHKANTPTGLFARSAYCHEVNKTLCSNNPRNNTGKGVDALHDRANSHNEDVLYLQGVE